MHTPAVPRRLVSLYARPVLEQGENSLSLRGGGLLQKGYVRTYKATPHTECCARLMMQK
jgi:hypothetical protein